MSRRLYLGRVDIGLDSKLELRRADGEATDKDVLAYLFCYGLIADQVFMQGSASLKSKQVQSAFFAFSKHSEEMRITNQRQYSSWLLTRTLMATQNIS